jgi:DNA-binding IclR family transcriptional regulator
MKRKRTSVRRQILDYLEENPKGACQATIARAKKLAQSGVSRHTNVMICEGLIKVDGSGKLTLTEKYKRRLK